MAQKHQDSEGELQPSPVPEDIARESEAPSESDNEHGQSDDGSDAPGSQNVLAAGWLVLEDGVVHRRILTWSGRARRRTTSGPSQMNAIFYPPKSQRLFFLGTDAFTTYGHS
jgi:hypothetical protein